MTVDLFGYQHSVYSWIAKIALQVKSVDYRWVEVDPFADTVPADYLALHPFQRVPTLNHDGFVLYETAAITRYLDDAFPGPALQPDTAKLRARQNQILAIIDSYGYWPLVRQVFVHGHSPPRFEGESDIKELEAGLIASQRILSALSDLVGTAPGYLLGDEMTLADIHLFPMIHYFSRANAGQEILQGFPALNDWHQRLASHPDIVATRPAFLTESK